MLPDIKLAIRLQSLDDRLLELTREIATLPKHIAEIEKKLESHQRRLEHDRAALAANQKDRKRFEGEIQIQEQKIAKLKAQMMEAKTNEQYRAFQHEIEFAEKEIRRQEDQILDLMGESEPLERNVKGAETALTQERKEVESEKARAETRSAEDQKQVDTLKQERQKILSEMAPAVASQYERIRKGRGGVAIAEAVDGRCSKCNMAVRLQFFQEIKRGDRLMFCESCGRILYYNPPESFEDLAPEAHEAARS
jgi:uncharacterized protein